MGSETIIERKLLLSFYRYVQNIVFPLSHLHNSPTVIKVNPKTWELRNGNIKIRGKVGIMASGQKELLGEAVLVNSFPLTQELYEQNMASTFNRSAVFRVPPECLLLPPA